MIIYIVFREKVFAKFELNLVGNNMLVYSLVE